MREIKAAGGMVMVQSLETTAFDGMPRSAISTGMVDYVTPIENMPQVLAGYVRHWYVNGAAPPAPVAEKAPDDLHVVIGILRAHIKYDFSCYKKGTLTRRVQRRMGLTHMEKMGEYIEILRRDKEEVKALYKDLLISVTNFFREPESWEALARYAIAALVREHDDETPIRVWVPGCATGEEPYSLTILLCEELRRADKVSALQIFASDIDLDALAFARAGIYPENIAADVSPERLRRFFVKGEHTYRINKDIREAVVFAEQNIVSDPPFSKLDLISCRNLLIYLEPEVQQKILSLFHFALREDGYLFLGGSETVTQGDDLFKAVSRKHRVYRRVSRPGYVRADLPSAGPRQPAVAVQAQATAVDRRAQRLTAVAQQVVAQRFAPACVLINRKAEVLYLNGPVDRYLQLPSGELGAELAAMARPGLRARLRTAVREAIQTDRPVALGGVRIKKNGGYFAARLIVDPLRHPPEVQGLLLVAFDEEDGDHRPRLAEIASPEPPREENESAADYEAFIHQLEEELRAAREDLQSTVEELETANEEFKASNEEITSVNEELQSANEELETSKEELQSLNEEIQTVNNQLEQKVTELEASNNDLNNLLASTDIATVFLDRGFCLKRFTPATKRLLRVIETDVGRPISDFALNFTDPDLLPDAERVLNRLAPIEREVQGVEGRYYLRRILPYRTEDDRIVGVVVTFDDVTNVKEHEQALERLAQDLDERVRARTAELEAANAALCESEEWLSLAVHSTGMGSWDLDLRTGTGRWSKNHFEIMDYEAVSGGEATMEMWRSRIHPGDRERVERELEEARRERSLFASEHRILRGPEGEPRWLSAQGRFFYAGDDAVRFVGVVQDITERKRMEQRITELAEEERQRLGR
ncbi:MAG: CheR family methyltransferase, partial [Gammaproteobacteria bacterium]